MGTAPLTDTRNPGLDMKRVNRAVARPGETLVRFSDALHRLAGRATFLHSDNGKYWYTTAPSLNKLAADIGAQLDKDFVLEAIDKALNSFVMADTSRTNFDAVHCAPSSSSDVPDESTGCRVVVLGVKSSHSSSNQKSSAMSEVKDIVGHRGTTPRVL